MPRFYLLGACDCPNPSAISKAQITLWEKQGIITYLGEAHDVREFIESSSCIVLPSYKEGVPRVLLEAMSMGKPIISTNVPGCKECIAPPLKVYKNLLIGQNGILIPPKNTQALITAMNLLTPTRIKEMGKRGRDFVKKRFDIHRIISHYLCTTAHIMNDKPPKANSQDSKPILAFVSNTSYAMYNFRLQVLKSLKDRGFDIHIIAPFDTSTPKLQNEGFTTHHFSIDSRSLNPLKDIRTLYHLTHTLRALKPQIVFNYTIKPAIYSSMLCNTLKIPNIAIITGLGYAFIEGGIGKKILHSIVCKMYRSALKKTYQVWFLNTDDMQEFLNHSLIKQSQAFLLDSEGVDCQYFTSSQCTQNKQDSKEMVFLLIARMLWDKGVGEFAEAAKIMQDK